MMNIEKIEEQVKSIMFDDMISGHSKSLGIDYCYTKPAREKYPFQYFWDTCFHIHILLRIGEYHHAKHHFSSLMAAQDDDGDDGFIGNIIYWKRVMPARFADFFQMKAGNIFSFTSPHMSSILQPPMLSETLQFIYETTGDKEFLIQQIQKLKKYYQWLQHRDFDGDGLLSIITSFESGMDWKPTYDPVVGFSGKANKDLFRKMMMVDLKNFLRNYNNQKIARSGNFNVKDVGFNAIYINNLYILAELCDELDDEDAAIFRKRADKVLDSLVKVCFDDDDEAFYDVDTAAKTKLKILTPTIFYPVVMTPLPEEIRQRVMQRYFYQNDDFKTPFPIPSVSKHDISFSAEETLFLWRGPVWIANNWFIHKYLVKNGELDHASQLIECILKLIEKFGFREYYNPFTGEGYGAQNFTWAGLVLDMIGNEEKAKQKN